MQPDRTHWNLLPEPQTVRSRQTSFGVNSRLVKRIIIEALPIAIAWYLPQQKRVRLAPYSRSCSQKVTNRTEFRDKFVSYVWYELYLEQKKNRRGPFFYIKTFGIFLKEISQGKGPNGQDSNQGPS
jgi:hypothetical protein